MRSFDLNTRKSRWTLYVGRAGRGEHRHRLRLDRLTLGTNRLRTWILSRGAQNQERDPASSPEECIHGIPVENLPPDWQDGYARRKESDPASRQEDA